MIKYIKLVMVFSLLAGLMFLTIPLGYLSADEADPQEQEQEIEQDEELEEEEIEEEEDLEEEELTVDQKKINAAVDKGVEFILKKKLKGDETELIILTLLHAGVDPKKNRTLRAAIRQLSASSLNDKFRKIHHKTYRIALTAMVLEKTNPHKYQQRIAECAQALVNYQCKNGQWSYDCRYNTAFGKPKKTSATVAPPEGTIITGKRIRPLKKIIVKRRNEGRAAEGDNSNTQFALLGLHAAVRCGVEIPRETWQDAADYLTKAQLPDGGWCYEETGRKVPYTMHSYGSMVCAGLCGLAIAKFYLNPSENLLANESIKKGLNWLASHWTFETNPGGVPFAQMKLWRVDINSYLYYYIYGIERVGVVLKAEEIGGRKWYQEGVQYLLAQQAKDGSWHNPKDTLNTKVNTCFAILFLKKATAPLKFKAIISGQSDDNK